MFSGFQVIAEQIRQQILNANKTKELCVVQTLQRLKTDSGELEIKERP
jgi:hypothetical protein